MAFDKSGFLSAKLEPRTKDVKVPGLKEWFKKEKPIWKVRGITALEVSKADESMEKQKDMAAFIEGMTGSAKEKTDAIKKMLGVDDTDNTPNLVRSLEIFTFGTVYPEGIDTQIAVKLADCYPIEFFMIVREILALTGLGKELGKVKPSGKTKK